MTERRISPSEVAWTLEYGKKYPHKTRPGKIYCVSSTLGIVIDPVDEVIITVWGRK
jgi:hypothetical protein